MTFISVPTTRLPTAKYHPDYLPKGSTRDDSRLDLYQGSRVRTVEYISHPNRDNLRDVLLFCFIVNSFSYI